MAFEGTKVRSTRNAATPIDGAREDLVAGETIACSLVSLPQVPVSYEWLCVGRPEGSVVGGGGTNPWPLGNGPSCAFVVDADGTPTAGGAGNATTDGTWVVQCTVNKGSRLETRFSVILARDTPIQLPGLLANRSLRKPGMFESLEDTISQAGVIPGWSTMTNRWLEWMRLKLGFKGADLASASNLLLPPAIGFLQVTGTTTINHMRITGRAPGETWRLRFASALTLAHNTASPPAGSVSLNMPGNANGSPASGSVWQFLYDGSVVHGGPFKT